MITVPTHAEATANLLRVTINPLDALIFYMEPEDVTEDFRKRLFDLLNHMQTLDDANWKKAENWDKLDMQLNEFYSDENNDPNDEDADPGLVEIGETAARAFGYL